LARLGVQQVRFVAGGEHAGAAGGVGLGNALVGTGHDAQEVLLAGVSPMVSSSRLTILV
jgi:hypothetical protein